MPSPALRRKPTTRDSGLHRQVNARLPGFLRTLRQRAALSQVALAMKIKRTQKYITDNERGLRRCSVSEFLEWADACGQDPVTAFAEFVALTRGKPPAASAKSKVAPYPLDSAPAATWSTAELNEAQVKPAGKRGGKKA